MQVTVTATYLRQDGVTPATGWVLFQRTSVLLDAAGNTISAPTLTRAKLDGDGHLEVALLANGGASPANTSYEVTEVISGAPERTWAMVLDGLSAAVDLADLSPAVAGDPSFTYVTQQAFDARVPDPTGEPDDRILKTSGGALTYTDPASASGAAPSPHLLGGTHHTADTLANLNLKVSDATLDDAGDSRTPTAHATSHGSGQADALAPADIGAAPAGDYVESPDVATIREVTQAEYDALTPDSAVLYVVVG